MMTFSADEKLEAIRREIKFREHVYPRRVKGGSMTQALADYQLSIFRAIEADYVKQAEKERFI